MPYVSFVERRGIALGEARGSARLLRCLLERRFGLLPSDTLAQLEGADAERLMAWSERVFDARTLAEVFVDDPRLVHG
jgi:hypothetical protein